MKSKQDKIEQFIKNPRKSFFKISLPIMVGMLVQTLYNIVDTAFVGRIGAGAIAAITLSFPVFFLLMSINSGIGVGTSSKISRLLGQNKKKEARNVAWHGIFISMIIAVVVLIVGQLTIGKFFELFNAEPDVLKMSVAYMRIILLGSIFMLPAYVMNNIFAAQGETSLSMKIQVSALILNMILDPIFIYVFKFGVAGAAMATTIAFSLSLFLTVYYNKKSYLNIKLSNYKFNKSYVKEIFLIGIPASATMVLMSTYFMVVNKLLSNFGTDHVAIGGIVGRLESVITMPIVSLSIGLMTLVGVYYGGKQYKLLNEIFTFSVKVGLIMTVVIGLLMFWLPDMFLRIFTNDETLINLARPFLKIDVFIFPFLVIIMMVNRTKQGMGFGYPGLIINTIRFIIITTPLALIFILVKGYGYLSIPVASLIGTMVAAAVAYIWMNIRFKKLHLLG